MAVIPDFLNSHGMRRFPGSVAQAADPGRGYREKKRQVELVGSVDAKRALAEESVKRGFFAEAIELYESAMQGPLGASDPTLLKGLGRARMLAGQGAEAEALFVQLKQEDPAAFDADAELDYARALALQNKNDEAVAQYEKVVARYPGEEARARFGLLLESMGQNDRAQALFTRNHRVGEGRAGLLPLPPAGMVVDREVTPSLSRGAKAKHSAPRRRPRPVPKARRCCWRRSRPARRAGSARQSRPDCRWS